MKILRKIVFIGTIMPLTGVGYSATVDQTAKVQPSSHSEILDLISSLKTKTVNSPERKDLRKMLRSYKPKTRADVRELIAAAQGTDVGDDAIFAIKQIDSTVPAEVVQEIVGQINVADDTTELRVLRTVLDVNVSRGFPGVREQIRARLIREPKTIIRKKTDKEFLWKNNWNKGKQIERVQILAEALVKLEGTGAIDTLFSLDEVMASGRAGLIVAPLGVAALNRAIKDFPNESDLRQEGCLEVIAFSTSSDAVPILEQLVESDNYKLRHAAVEALLRADSPNVDRILEKMRKDDNQGIRKFAEDSLHRRHPENYKQDLIDALSGQGPISCTAALGILAERPMSGTEEALERFIRKDEKENRHNPTLRFFAAKSVWKLTGRKIEYDRGLATYEKYPWEK